MLPVAVNDLRLQAATALNAGMSPVASSVKQNISLWICVRNRSQGDLKRILIQQFFILRLNNSIMEMVWLIVVHHRPITIGHTISVQQKRAGVHGDRQ